MVYITFLLKRDEKKLEMINMKNIEIDFIKFKDFITPNRYIGNKKNDDFLR